MHISSPASPAEAIEAPLLDAKLAKRFTIACGLAPLALLAWDTYQGNLGVNGVNYAIRSTGLVGLIFLTLSLVITPLRKLTGLTWLHAARRNLGVLGFVYIALHFGIFFVFDRELSVSSTLEEITSRVYLWFGTAALVILLPLAITSFDAMVTRLGPVRWKRLHRTAYLAVLAGAIHYLLLVKADTTKPIVFMALFGGLMLYRVTDWLRPGLPPARSRRIFWSGELVVASITHETHDVKTFRFLLPDSAPLTFQHSAGQYLSIALPIDGKTVKRSYTISSSPSNEYVEISVKRAAHGYASHYLHDKVAVGDRLKISGPAGRFHFPGVTGTHADKRVVMIAGGVGITPMISVIRSLTSGTWNGDIYLVFGVRSRTDVIFAEELRRLEAAHATLHVTLLYSSETGHLTADQLRTAVPDFTHGPVMMCGPAGMMVATRALLVGMGVPNHEIHEEAFVSPSTPKEDDAPSGDTSAIDPDAPRAYEFKRTNKSVELPGGLTVLEAAEECGVTIPYECRSGICGQCKTKLVSGRVVMESTDALTTKDRASNIVLACQAVPISDIAIDA